MLLDSVYQTVVMTKFYDEVVESTYSRMWYMYHAKLSTFICVNSRRTLVIHVPGKTFYERFFACHSYYFAVNKFMVTISEPIFAHATTAAHIFVAHILFKFEQSDMNFSSN